MSQPSWDGNGTDPWLPERLAQRKAIQLGERTVYDDYYARLSAWMVKAYRRLQAAPLPGPDLVWALVPDWVQSMAEFANTTIRGLVGAAYATLIGPTYRFDKRPYVTRYLGEVQNRLIDLPDQVYNLVVEQVAEGAGLGEGIPAIRNRIQQVFDTTDTPYWPNRATVVARTETISALNAGRTDAFLAVAEELGDDEFEQGWLATHDTRTRPTHRAADIGTPLTGQRVPLGQPFIVGGVPLMFPGDPAGPASECVQCRCTTVLLRPGEDLDLSDRQMVDFR